MTTRACCPTCGALSPCSVLASVRNILTAQPSPTLHRTSILELNELLLYASSPESALACGQLGYHPDVKRSIVLCRIYQKTLHWEAIVWNNNIFEIDHPLSACFINRLLPYSNLGKNTFLCCCPSNGHWSMKIYIKLCRHNTSQLPVRSNIFLSSDWVGLSFPSAHIELSSHLAIWFSSFWCKIVFT